MKRLRRLLVLLCMGLPLSLHAQSNQVIRQLEGRRTELQKQIDETEKLLAGNRKSVNSLLGGLESLNGQIEERKQYIAQLNRDVITMTNELNRLETQYGDLQRRLHKKQEEYSASVQYLYRNRSVEEKLLFILSAKSLEQSYRRLRYVREYADYQRMQGEEIKKEQTLVSSKRLELEQVKQSNVRLLAEIRKEQQKLEGEEKEQQRLVENLRRQQRALRQEIDRKRREANRLNDRIDRLIAENAKKSKTPETPSVGRAERELTGSFAGNRGKLPMPLTGPSIIISRYGQYAVAGLRNVKLDNKGIDIQGRPGAEARAIFNGKVVAIFKLNGLFNVLIRHGSYISVYCNLTNVTVKQDETVTTRQPLGVIFSDENDNGRTVLHFQLRKEKEKLNPEQWINPW
jgi:septal ring factor EnvC (AmiA/AmiB activator)